MLNVYNGSMKKLCNEGFGDLVVEIIKDKLPISFQKNLACMLLIHPMLHHLHLL
jgi:cyanate lyase